MSDLRQFAAIGWRDKLASERKPATVNRKLVALSHDPRGELGAAISGPQGPQRTDVARILRKAHLSGNPRDSALLELLAATGLWASEIASLRMRDLDLGEQHGWVTLHAPNAKGRVQRRVVQEYLTSRGPLAPEEPIFPSQKSGTMTPYTVWYTVKKYAHLAEVKDVSPHSFRHTVATQLVRDPETDLVLSAAYLGHSRLDTTARYSQPSEEELAEAAERLRIAEDRGADVTRTESRL